MALVIASLCAFLCVASDATARTVVLRWRQPDIAFVTGFTLHLGETSGSYGETIEVGMATPDPEPGVFQYDLVVDTVEYGYVVVTAHNALGVDSLFSNEKSLLDCVTDLECTDGNVCNGPETCQAGSCVPGSPLLPGSFCGDAGDGCTNQDTCDSSGTCTDNGFAVAGFSCGDAGDECTNQDRCDGSGTCTDNGFAVAGFSCGDAGDECTNADRCDGSGTCTDNGFAVAGFSCGDAGDECTNPDTCDGSGTCTDNGFAVVGLSCGDAGDECTSQNSCDGSGTCTVDAAPDGTACDDGNAGTPIDVCIAGVCVGSECVGNDDCSDGDVCNGDEVCLVGSCAAGAPLDCSDSGEFLFVLIAESTDDPGTPLPNSINDSGMVVFEASGSLMVGDGVQLDVIATTGASGIPWINDLGSVAFVSSIDGGAGSSSDPGSSGIFVGDVSEVTMLAGTDGDRFTSFGTAPSMNNRGQVAFRAGLSDYPMEEGLFLFDLGTAIEIGRTVLPNYFGSRVAINDQNQVAFHVVQPGDGMAAIYRTDGSVTVEIVDTTGSFVSLDSPGSINDFGEVAFGATLDTGDIGVFVGDGVSIIEVFRTDGNNGGVQLYQPVTNNAGAVAFALSVFEDPASGAASMIPSDAIFVSPGPREVIRTGDSLSGGVVHRLDFFGSMNDSGEIAFCAELEDGRVGVYKAVPVPEPHRVLLAAAVLLTLAALSGRRRAGASRRRVGTRSAS